MIQNEKDMGLFDFLKNNDKEKGPEIKDLIWMNQNGKLRGFLRLVDEKIDATWVAWSTHTQAQFQQLYQAETGRSIRIELAANLNPSSAPLYFVEHHPQYQKEQVFFQAVKPKKVVFLTALDDPIMQLFGSERITAVMERMGMTEDEVIEHKMITRSLQNAQKKLDEPGAIEQMAVHYPEWVNGIRDY